MSKLTKLMIMGGDSIALKNRLSFLLSFKRKLKRFFKRIFITAFLQFIHMSLEDGTFKRFFKRIFKRFLMQLNRHPGLTSRHALFLTVYLSMYLHSHAVVT